MHVRLTADRHAQTWASALVARRGRRDTVPKGGLAMRRNTRRDCATRKPRTLTLLQIVQPVRLRLRLLNCLASESAACAPRSEVVTTIIARSVAARLGALGGVANG